MDDDPGEDVDYSAVEVPKAAQVEMDRILVSVEPVLPK